MTQKNGVTDRDDNPADLSPAVYWCADKPSAEALDLKSLAGASDTSGLTSGQMAGDLRLKGLS